MRPKERIPIIWQYFADPDIRTHYISEHNNYLTEDQVKEKSLLWYENQYGIKKFWLENQYLRLTQVLIHFDILQNVPGFWFYKEEHKWLIKNDYAEPRDILLWGQNYDKDMNRLEKTIFKPIKDLSTDHIKAILEGEYTNNQLYLETFKEELKRRNVRD